MGQRQSEFINQMKKHHPPILATRLLKWYAGKAEMEDLDGDLDELFQQDLIDYGRFKASLHYWSQILSLVFSYALKKRKRNSSYSNYYQTNSIAMLRNYFKIAVRNFSKHKLFTSLNIIGLALGMTICLLAIAISVAIFKSDSNQLNKERIYQLNTYISEDDEDRTLGSTFPAAGYYLEENYPFIEKVVKINSSFNPEVNHYGNLMNFHGYYADESFFQVFTFQLISGDPNSALSDPFNLVITKQVADRLYKNEDPIGKTLETADGTFTITGVMEDLKQTHFYFEMLSSYSTYKELNSGLNPKDDWSNLRNNYLYVLLKDEKDAKSLPGALAQVSEKANGFLDNATVTLESINLSQVVPRWNISNALGIAWDYPSIMFFFFIGSLILVPAIFNYTNLSIARALKRAKEIGIRKVVGAEKSQIKAQFFIETIILCVLALIISISLYTPMKNEFLELVYAAEVLDTSMGISQIVAFVSFAILIGLLAGAFPAKFFSKLNPLETMKGDIHQGKIGVSGFKKGLFIFQFFASLVFIIGVGTIARQYSYVLNTNHGFDSDNVLTVPFEGINKQLVMNELGNHPDVKSITSSSSLPGVLISNLIEITSNELDTIAVNQVFVGEGFQSQLDIALKWGNETDLDLSNQTEENVIVNAEFFKAIKVFNVQKDSMRFTLGDGTRCKVVGILDDMNFEPLTEDIDPLVLRTSLDNSNYALLTINTTDIKKTVTELEQVWENIDQNISFESRFLNDEIEDAYWMLLIQIQFFSYLSALSITISCLGLLGMVSYTTENRTKEVAVRKILGASTKSLYLLLTRDFVKLIMIASVLAIPFSYFFYDKLFLYFLIKYGLGLGPIEVITGIVFLFLVGFISIYFQTNKITRANPATKLRYE